jgi:hypothetical protein
MGAHFFNLKKINFATNFCPSASQGKRPLAELSGYTYLHSPFYEACCFDELNRGFILGPEIDANNK